MAASAQDNPPIVINLTVASFDRRITDQAALLRTAEKYLQEAGYSVKATEAAGMGAAATGTGIGDIPGVPQLGKVALWGLQLGLKWLKEKQQRLLEGLFPLVDFTVWVDPRCGRYELPSMNIFGGIVALLPGLHEHLQEEHRHRRYSFTVTAPASPQKREQRAHLSQKDLKTPRLLKLARRAARARTNDRTHFYFNSYFPYMLEELVLPSPTGFAPTMEGSNTPIG